MSYKIMIPRILTAVTNGKKYVTVRGRTIKEVLSNIDKKYDGFAEQVLEKNGAVKNHIFICVNEENIQYLDGLKTKLNPGDRIDIIAAIAGG